MTDRKTASSSAVKRWISWFLMAALFAVACVFLSNWQFNRRQEALERIALVAANYDAQPVSIDDLTLKNAFNAANEWRPTELSGHYLIENAVWVRNRPLNGQPGFLQLVPFQLTDGRVVAVERGWVAAQSQLEPPAVMSLPSDKDQVILARIRKQEQTLDRTAPPGQVATINIDSLTTSEKLNGEFFADFYVRVYSESLPSDTSLKQLSKPRLDEGNHLSYALQWILFALMAFAALWWALRQELMARRGVVKTRKRMPAGQQDMNAEDRALEAN